MLGLWWLMAVFHGFPCFPTFFFWSFWCIDQPHLCMLKDPQRLLQDVWEAATAKAALRRDGLFASEANLQRCPGNPFRSKLPFKISTGLFRKSININEQRVIFQLAMFDYRGIGYSSDRWTVPEMNNFRAAPRRQPEFSHWELVYKLTNNLGAW